MYNRYWDFENYTTISLKQDNTFTFSGQEGCLFLKTEGIWSLFDEKLIIESYPDTFKKEVSTVMQEKMINNDSVEIIVNDNAGEPLCGCYIEAFKDSLNITKNNTGIDGIAYIDKHEYDSIRISFIGYTPLVYTGKCNYIEIKIGLSESALFRLEKQYWNVKRDKLIDPRFKSDQKRNLYKKVKPAGNTAQATPAFGGRVLATR